MKKQSEVCLQKRPTPLQDIILQTAENHLSRCEPIFGISRYYKRLSGTFACLINTLKDRMLRPGDIGERNGFSRQTQLSVVKGFKFYMDL